MYIIVLYISNCYEGKYFIITNILCTFSIKQEYIPTILHIFLKISIVNHPITIYTHKYT